MKNFKFGGKDECIKAFDLITELHKKISKTIESIKSKSTCVDGIAYAGKEDECLIGLLREYLISYVLFREALDDTMSIEDALRGAAEAEANQYMNLPEEDRDSYFNLSFSLDNESWKKIYDNQFDIVVARFEKYRELTKENDGK